MLPPKRQSKRQISGLALAGLLVLATQLMSGCSNAPKSTETPSAAPGQAQKQTVSAPTQTAVQQGETSPADVYVYSPSGRRDPFAPIMERESKKAKSGERPPLERYNISEFKVSGVLWGGFGYSGMLEGPDGKGYVVKVGTVIGPNKGVVKKINQNTIIIEEKYKTYSGETERKEIILELRKKQEDAP